MVLLRLLHCEVSRNLPLLTPPDVLPSNRFVPAEDTAPVQKYLRSDPPPNKNVTKAQNFVIEAGQLQLERESA